MDDSSFWLIVGCAVVCVGIAGYSYYKARKNIVDDGAQHVVTIGVLCTFGGIAVALYNFDTNTENMIKSIDIFLDSMKFAFVTSIIGMGAGLVIKFFQWKLVEREKILEHDDTLKNILLEIRAVNNAELLKNILSELQAENDSGKKNSVVMSEINGAMKINAELLRNILSEVRAQDNSELSRELGKFVAATGNFAIDMKNLSNSMNAQSRMLENLSTTLANSIEAFGDKQIARLDAMKTSIEQMKISTAQAEKNFADLLDATKNFQQQSLANDNEQAKILSDNTAQIVAMKNSFDKFLEDMAENFSQNFIAALNESIKQLNTQLQEQFGENFKELNAAVREVVVWQREYKEIVTKTTDELKVINQTFNREVLSELHTALKTFADASEKNVSVQNDLYHATAQLSTIVTQAEMSIAQMQTVTEKFGEFSDDILNKNISLLKSHLDNLARLEETFAAKVKNLNDIALSVAMDTRQYLKDFNETSEASMRVIRDTIASYKTDLRKETEESLSNLSRMFKTVAENTDKQSDKAIKSLAGALSEVSGKMIGNYKVLVAKIAEVDELLRRRAG